MAELNLEDFEELLKVSHFNFQDFRMKTSRRTSVLRIGREGVEGGRAREKTPAAELGLKPRATVTGITEVPHPRNEVTEVVVLMKRRNREDSTKTFLRTWKKQRNKLKRRRGTTARCS